MAQQPTLKLRGGKTIPQLGLGVWQVDSTITARVVTDAISSRHFLALPHLPVENVRDVCTADSQAGRR